MSARDFDHEQLSFKFDLPVENAEQPLRTATIHRFPDTLGQRVRQQAIQRVVSSGIFSVDDLKEG